MQDLMTDTTDEADLRVEVVGFQWQWRFGYPDEGITIVGTPEAGPPELVLPVGETVRFDLVAVPDIAYGHHEKLDGRGYPRGVRAEDIPVQTRIMTIADIFDALTASDRPYKRALGPDRALDVADAERGEATVQGEPQSQAGQGGAASVHGRKPLSGHLVQVQQRQGGLSEGRSASSQSVDEVDDIPVGLRSLVCCHQSLG